MKLLYFAWLKEKIGVNGEDCLLPDGVTSVAELVAWLTRRGNGYAEAFQDLSLIRVAVNQQHVGLDCSLSDGDEVAFFPPVTGG